MPRVGEGMCTYCGNAFTFRKEPLGRSLCTLCLNILRERYSHQLITHLAQEFAVGTDAIKSWAQRHRLQRQLVCINCGREFESKSASSGICPICALAQRPR